MAGRAIKVCKYCQEENLSWARYCRGCQAAIDETPVTLVSRPLALPRSLILGLMLCLVAYAVCWSLIASATKLGTSRNTSEIKVLWHKFYGNYGQEWIVGEIRNQSSETLSGIQVVGEYFSEDGHPLDTGQAPLDNPALAPGQTSHFKVSVPYMSEIQKSRFHFQAADGSPLSFDRR